MVPPLPRCCEALRLPAAPPASLRSFASRYRRAPPASLPQTSGAPSAGQGLFTGFPKPVSSTETTGPPRFLEDPYVRALLFDPGGTSVLGHCRTSVLSSAFGMTSTPTITKHFEAQSHGPHIRCLRFAGWVTPPLRKTRFRRLASLTGRDWLPAGSQRKVSGHSLLLSQALPGAPQKYLKFLKMRP